MRVLIGIIGLIWKLHIAVVFFITAIIFYPLIVPLLFSDSTKKHTFKLFVAWSWCVRIFCLYFVSKKLNSDLPTGPYIIVANHMSYLDIFLLPSILPQERFLFLGKSEILKYPLIKTYFKHLNIPVFRKNPIKAGKSLVKAKKEVRKGWSLVIFPEGGIPDEQVPKMVEFKEGAFQLAKSCRVPIVPITYTNNHRLFSDPSNFLGPARPGISHVYIHPFLKKEEVKELSQKELSDTCFNIVNAPILEQYPHLKD